VRIGELPDSGLIAARLGSIRRVICASPQYFAKRGRPKVPNELCDHDCITFVGLADAWSFARGKSQLRVAIRSRLGVNTAEAAIDAAVAGAGVTRVLSYQIAGALRTHALEIALADFEPPPWPLNLVYGGGLLPLKLRAFLDFAAPRLRARLSESEGKSNAA
jgi:DNA-binding transcriptional LysR family regulator